MLILFGAIFSIIEHLRWFSYPTYASQQIGKMNAWDSVLPRLLANMSAIQAYQMHHNPILVWYPPKNL